MYAYREIYKLDKWISSLHNDITKREGVELYALPHLGVSFIEISAPSDVEIQSIDKQCTSKIISFCERQNVEEHLFGSLTKF